MRGEKTGMMRVSSRFKLSCDVWLGKDSGGRRGRGSGSMVLLCSWDDRELSVFRC